MEDRLKRALLGHMNFVYVYASVVTKSDPTLIVLGQSENNRVEFHNAFMLRAGQIISLCFKMKNVVG